MTNWVADIDAMHTHYGFHEKVRDMDHEKLYEMLKFRFRFLQEELDEMGRSIDTRDPEGVVDALVDLCVVAIGTLNLYGVNEHEAWNRVHAANMSKKTGVKASRPNPLGLPDLIKPEGWCGPTHEDNHGLVAKALSVEPRQPAPTDILK